MKKRKLKIIIRKNKKRTPLQLRLHLWYLKNKKRLLKAQKVYLKKKRTKKLRRISLRNWRIKHQKAHKRYLEKYYIKNKKRLNRLAREWRRKNKKKFKQYEVQMKTTNIQWKIRYILRNRLHQAIIGNYKSGSAVKDLGCSISFFKDYIEDMFYNKMTWGNYGKYWILDHIDRLGSFDLSKRKQFLKAVHFTNLQPLTIPDHKKKTAKERSEAAKKIK